MIERHDDIFGDNEANSLIVKDNENNNIFTDSMEMVNGLSLKIKNATNQNIYKHQLAIKSRQLGFTKTIT